MAGGGYSNSRAQGFFSKSITGAKSYFSRPPTYTVPSIGGEPGFTTKSSMELLRYLASKKQTNASAKSETSTAKNKKTTQDTALTRPMEAMGIGDAVPVVFCRRRTGGTGGVMVKPRATECRFSNTAAAIEAAYHCVLGEGYIYPIQTRDVRNGPNRQGSYSQNYGLRAGTWRPERLVTEQTAYNVPEFPQNVGGGGDYNGVSTIEFRNSFNPKTQLDNWKLHWSVFVRDGMRIDRGRVLDSVVGPSDNFCDLYIWAQVSARLMSVDQFDMAEMQKAAQFLEVNQLYCNAEFDKGTSLPDFLTSILPVFLLRETSVGGKFALRPIVPTNSDGTIKTTAITPEWIFDERSISPGSYDEKWPGQGSKRLIQFNVLWRQQTSDIEIPFVRDLQIMADGVTNPTVETFDLSEVVTSEPHAALAGGYRQAMRYLGQGTASVRLPAGNQTGMLRAGMIIQIVLGILTEVEFPDSIREFWWVDSILFGEDGSETLQLVHCPVNASGQSLVALHMVAARTRAPGFTLPYPPDIGAEDAPGRESDATVPASTTSGVPFSQGGGGATSGFNRTTPPAPPANNPPPPTDGGPGEPAGPGDGAGGINVPDTGKAGGEPTNPETGPRRVPAQWVRYIIPPPKAEAWPGECEYGAYRIRTSIEGALVTGTVVNYLVITIEEVTAEIVGADPVTYVPPGASSPVTIMCDRYEVRIQEQIPTLPRIETVWSIVGPGVDYPFSLTTIDWQCNLKDGGVGPVRTPESEPVPLPQLPPLDDYAILEPI